MVEKEIKQSSIFHMLRIGLGLTLLFCSLLACSLPIGEEVATEQTPPTFTPSTEETEITAISPDNDAISPELEISDKNSTNNEATPTVVPVSGQISTDSELDLDLVSESDSLSVNPALKSQLQALQTNITDDLQAWIAAANFARPNGYVYAVDIGQLMLYFANQGDFENYMGFRQLAIQYLILDDPSDPYTQGFVGWRYNPSEALDASGTSEALLIAKGLWQGFQKFYDPSDEELTLLILDGYAKHAFVDQGIWLIRNYFNLKTRSFAPNSYLVDYDPDFLHDMSTVINKPELVELTTLSNELIRKGQTPSGLLHSIVLPELKTLYPDTDLVVFSPNDVIQFSNACAVAEKTIKTDPQLARNFLQFTTVHLDNLMTYYYGQTNEPLTEDPARLSEWTCLVRVAAKLNDTALTEQLIERALPFWRTFDEQPGEPKLYQAGQILLAIDAVLEE